MNIYFKPEFHRNFGTFPLKGDQLHGAVEAAIKVGYRAFDTAQMYGNEAELGDALANSDLGRDEFCVTTKVKAANYSESGFIPSVEASLKALRLDQADVLLLHWPPADEEELVPALRLLEDAFRRGLARNIGVSNFTSRMLRTTRAVLDAPVAINQVEFHPLLNQEVLLGATVEIGIPLSAYCSLARGKVLQEPELLDIAEGYGKSAGQVALRWILQKGVVPVTMSSNPKNISANFDICDFTLSSVDMGRIDKLTARNYRIVNKSIVPGAPDWD